MAPQPTSSKNIFEQLPSGSEEHTDATASASVEDRAAAEGPPQKKSKYHNAQLDVSDYETDDEDKMDLGEGAPAPIPAAPRLYREGVEQIPENLKFQEFSSRPDIDPFSSSLAGYDVSCIHSEYCGKDKPVLPNLKVARESAMVMFMDEKSGKTRLVQGSIPAGKKKEDKDKVLMVSINMDRQMPCVTLEVARPDSDKVVTYRVFANCIRPADPNTSVAAGISMQTYTEDMDETDIKDFNKSVARGHSHLVSCAKEKNLMQLTISLYQPQKHNPRAYQSRPLFSGISELELKNIRNKDADDKLWPTMSTFERTICFLDRAANFIVFRRLYCSDLAQLEKFKNFFVGSMHLCSQFRNFWYYQLQTETPDANGKMSAEGNISGRKCDLELTQPPRWMVTKFLAYSATQGSPVTKVDPLTWAAFSEFRQYPSVQDYAFLVRLALARERNSQRQLIRDMEDSSNGVCHSRFKSMDGLPGAYFAKISIPGVAPGMRAELVKPELETRIKLRVAGMGGDVKQYEGKIVKAPKSEDVGPEQGKDFDFAAQVWGPVYDFGTSKYDVQLQFIDDRTTVDRGRNATESMVATQLKRKEGVDIPAVILRAKGTIPANKLNAGLQLPKEKIDEALKRVKDIQELNPGQIDAVKSTMLSTEGLALIYSPLGTGKTTAVTAAAHEHVRLGDKVIYTCASNKAVDAALSAFRKYQDATIRAVRFVGGLQSFEKKRDLAAPGADMTVFDGLANPTITAATKANPDSMFHIKREKSIRKWAEIESHRMHDKAKEYFDNIGNTQKLSSQKAKQKAKDIKILNEEFTDYFVQNEVDIVFTTCSSACHPTLNGNFKLVAAFIDEAGQATIPDTCMALDPFKESIKWLTMSGDYQQLTPVVTTQTTNEALSSLADSLFRQLLTDPDSPYTPIMLTRQYRKHPDLIRWPNKMFYEGKLETDDIATKDTPESRTARRFFDQLGKGKKNLNSRRIALDVSGENAISKAYGDTKSFCNPEEARYIVGLVRKLLVYRAYGSQRDAPGKYAPVQPRNIGIITPYKGQQRLIRNLLMANGPNTPESKVVTEGTVSTTWGIQGSEVDIALISLVVRDPANALNKTKFVAIQNGLCVMHTRARHYQVTTGNFKGWLKANMMSDKGGKLASTPYKAFRNLSKDFYTENDIVLYRDVEPDSVGG
ncbi:hypothetical protein EK21DRAFT_92416 [Setomelanomma holmii]|uniref:DNA2/NAM7 helicase-like C-terminal domain-containing protein n=1 Tax=Setomelanomma holmii TaxID=210430 RepID=A0A9P4H0Z3_9PLEO|nr:hypothetical protein EK21DRAFT_92416 [Setomelanomma holmii]